MRCRMKFPVICSTARPRSGTRLPVRSLRRLPPTAPPVPLTVSLPRKRPPRLLRVRSPPARRPPRHQSAPTRPPGPFFSPRGPGARKPLRPSPPSLRWSRRKSSNVSRTSSRELSSTRPMPRSGRFSTKPSNPSSPCSSASTSTPRMPRGAHSLPTST